MDKPKQLTDEQKRRIEENRKKALQIKKSKELANGPNQATSLPTSAPVTQVLLNNNLAIGTSSNNNSKFENGKITSFYSSGPSSIHASSNAPKKTDNAASNVLQTKFNSSNSSAEKRLHATFNLITRNRFKVEVGYNVKVLEALKTIPSRSYEMKHKSWNFHIEDHDRLVKALSEIDNVSFTPIPSGVLKIFQKATTTGEICEADISALDSKLKESLLPFQKLGVYFGINHGGRVLIADDMGLGKTIQSIAIASYYIREWPLLVVCPSSVRYSWLESFHTWLPSLRKTEITMIDTNKIPISHGKVFIMSYEMLSRKKKDVDAKRFQVIIYDECHFLKNYKSSRTKAAQSAARNAKRVLLLSGTPALSRPMELYTQICMIKPNLFGNFVDYGIRYCAGKSTNFGWDFSGSCNMEELHLVLQETVMIRRLKSEVMTQLPPKRRQVIMLDPSKIKKDKKHFDAYSKEMVNTDLKAMEKRGVLLQYFRDTGIAKVAAVCDYINDILEANYKFLCFAHHRIILDEIARMLAEKGVGFMRIDGSTPAETRKLNCDRFQLTESCKVALLSITAANAGINLCAATLVVFAELFWNPGILTQAEDRAHRIGQQDSVIVQYLVAEGTSDDHMWPLIQEKLETLSKAGLSKDNFKESDTFVMASKDPSGGQTSIEDYFMNDCDDFFNDVDLENFNETEVEDDAIQPVIKKPHLLK